MVASAQLTVATEPSAYATPWYALLKDAPRKNAAATQPSKEASAPLV